MQLERLKEWRESQGFTQKELAGRAGVGEVTVARVETGASIRPNTARKIAGALGLAVSDLLARPPSSAEPAPKASAPPSVQPSFNDALEEERRIKRLIGEEERIRESPFSKLPERTRVNRLSEWLDRLVRLRDRREVDLKPMREGSAPYERWLEMHSLDRLWWGLFENGEGVHTHIERVTRGEMEVSPEEYDLCRAVNGALGDVNNLTNEARELQSRNRESASSEAARGIEAMGEELERIELRPPTKP